MEWLNRLLRSNKKEAEPPRNEQTAELGWLSKEFAAHPGKNLTPARAAGLLLEGERGNLQAIAEIADDMEERDTHLFAELMKRRRACLSADWKLELSNADTNEQKSIDQLTELLSEIPLPDVLFDLTDAIHKGYSNIEMEWGQAEGLWLPSKLEHRPAAWFMCHQDNRNQLLLRTMDGAGESLQSYTWLSHTQKARSGYLTNTALARVTLWPFLFRTYSSRDFAEFLEIYGLPVRLGRYPSGASEPERSRLLAAVTAIGHNAAGILPANMAIEFQNAAAGEPDAFLAMIHWAEKSISKAILGGTLTSEVDGKGSYAAAQTHDEVRWELRQADLRQLSKTLTRDLIQPLVLFNTTLTRVPQFVFDDTEPEDMALYADALPKLASIMDIPVDWARRKLKIPTPAKDELVLRMSRSGSASAAQLKSSAHHSTGCTCCGSTMAVLKEERADNVQSAIDKAVIGMGGMQLQAQDLLQPILDSAAAGLQAGQSAESVLAGLMADFPLKDDASFIKALAQAMLVAELAGQLEAQQEVHNEQG
jgi:phage gp29-like protein